MDRLSRPCKPVWTDGLDRRVGWTGRSDGTDESEPQTGLDGRTRRFILKFYDYLVPKKMLVFHVKEVKTEFVEIVCQRVSNKIIHFIVQNPFFDYSDMSLTWTLNFVKIVIFWPFSTIVTCRINRKSINRLVPNKNEQKKNVHSNTKY
ncbi:hypothetical protein BpHYR1_003919 [Brachionus plicatilis]|uniref:Uncharacterized protein n=1 Tax=Brachionus plicatilis TaxID=10195 RepID=A0A3M7REH4_BRAPC|nr:hypothetical protein BpHYR1_003919 [Brachionus plicatilis]